MSKARSVYRRALQGAPGRGPPLCRVERAFPGWEITDAVCADTEPDALARLFAFEERFFRLRHKPGA